MQIQMRCSADGCEKEPRRGGLCWGHRKQVQRGRELRPLLPPGGKRGSRTLAALGDGSVRLSRSWHERIVRSASAVRMSPEQYLVRILQAWERAMRFALGTVSAEDPDQP